MRRLLLTLSGLALVAGAGSLSGDEAPVAPTELDPVIEATAAYSEGRSAEAVRILKKAAEAGDPLAAANLGVMIASGEGWPQNDIEALYWLWKARLEGERRSEPLAKVVAERVSADDRDELLDRLAMDLEADAKAGRRRALLSLGGLEWALRTPPDAAQAYVWFGLAAAMGDPLGAAARDKVAENLSAEERRQGQDTLTELFKGWTTSTDQ